MNNPTVFSRVLFAAALLFVVTPWSSPPLALALGVVFGLTTGNPFLSQSRRVSKLLLQFCVVGLGFGMNLHQVVRAGTSGFIYTLAGITLTLLAGVLLGKAMRVGENETLLISVGTAICGGSAIAAVGPVVGARDEQMSVSLGTVFVLNAIALLTFPLIGSALELTQSQFGLWAALAIHDTSSVVGAAERYGATALAVGTTVKLARALWIVPLALLVAAWKKNSNVRIQWPWFIVFFVAAAIVATYIPAGADAYRVIVGAAKIGLAVTLFLIGSGLTMNTLREVGVRALMMGLALWTVVSCVTLVLIRSNVIAL